MPTDCIPYRDTGYFSQLICDYLDGTATLQSFYNHFPKLENFEKQLVEKKASFNTHTRKVLSESLASQYERITMSEATATHIEQLKESTTFTITTGHQLNLFTGPLYFLYKIISVINLTKQLKTKYPEYDFVPIYWMATEDHDFEEINYFRFRGKKVQWNRKSGGAVGELSTEGLEAVFDEFSAQLGTSKTAQDLRNLFIGAYLEHEDLAAATRYLANELFKVHGLVIVDGNDGELKKLYAPYIKRELQEQITHKQVVAQTEKLVELGYSEQVHPREINLFFLAQGVRERIIREGNTYRVNDTTLSYSEAEFLQMVDEYPIHFSPNALLRPLYQEVILPNLCYIGGGGELAYWFQLKTTFEAFAVPFPMLLLRNSAMLQTEKQAQKITKLDVTLEQLFLKQNELINQKIRSISNIEIDLSEQRNHLQTQFKALHDIATLTDASFKGAVAAQEKKQLKGLQHLEKRLLKAQRKKLGDHVERLTTIQNALFPEQSLQERNTNFAEFYLEHGDVLIPTLFDSFDPLGHQFTVVTM